MPIYIVLTKLTEQGAKNIKESLGFRASRQQNARTSLVFSHSSSDKPAEFRLKPLCAIETPAGGVPLREQHASVGGAGCHFSHLTGQSEADIGADNTKGGSPQDRNRDRTENGHGGEPVPA